MYRCSKCYLYFETDRTGWGIEYKPRDDYYPKYSVQTCPYCVQLDQRMKAAEEKYSTTQPLADLFQKMAQEECEAYYNLKPSKKAIPLPSGEWKRCPVCNDKIRKGVLEPDQFMFHMIAHERFGVIARATFDLIIGTGFDALDNYESPGYTGSSPSKPVPKKPPSRFAGLILDDDD
jgi:hypothetical protein